ncbi:MAG: ATP synthase subunit C [Spirochaetota bacterium]
MNQQQKAFKRRTSYSFLIIGVLMAVMSLFVTLPVNAQSQEGEEVAPAASQLTEEDAQRQKWGMLAAAAAFGFGAIGAGMAISKVGSAAMGAMSERPEVGGQALIFVAMAEGIVIFGFISALMILGKF